MITIYHNPRCSKSREALALVETIAARRRLPLNVVEYLKTPPDLAQLSELKAMLRCAAIDMVRSNEAEYNSLGLAHADDSTLLRAVATHPGLLQRPIVVFEGRAVIGRPPELVADLLDGDEA